MGEVQSCLACDNKRAGQADRIDATAQPRGAPRPISPRSVASTAASSVGDGLAKVGIGAYFQRSKDDQNFLLVKSVLKGSPASIAGRIKVGDTILTVDGESVYGHSLAELAEKLLGYAGTEVRCSFKTASTNEEYEVTLVRGINAPRI